MHNKMPHTLKSLSKNIINTKGLAHVRYRCKKCKWPTMGRRSNTDLHTTVCRYMVFGTVKSNSTNKI